MATTRAALCKVVEASYFTRFLTLCVLFNTLLLAIEYDGMSEALVSVLSVFNLTFTITFMCELVLKLGAYGFTAYFSDGFNVFDCIIVVLSIIELVSSS